MIRKIKTNQLGLTYVELLVAIGIISILSAISMFYIKSNATEDVKRSTEQLAADIRLARNMSISRTVFKFNDGTTAYPEDGYGVYCSDPVSGTSYYVLYAGRGGEGFDGGGQSATPNGDQIIKKIYMPNSRLELNDTNSTVSEFYFSFLTENSISTNLGKDTQSRYIITVLDPCVITNTNGSCQSGYRGVIRLGEKSGDQYTMPNVGVSYNKVVLPLPPPPPPDPSGTRSLAPAAGGDDGDD